MNPRMVKEKLFDFFTRVGAITEQTEMLHYLCKTQ